MARNTTRRRKAGRTTAAIPREADEQKLLFEWAEYAELTYPELELMFHIPNEGYRSKRAGAELRKQGLRRGVPDICLPVPRGIYGALYIEMKRTKRSKTSEDQNKWLEKLNSVGNRAVLCHGFDEAKAAILEYLNTKHSENKEVM